MCLLRVGQRSQGALGVFLPEIEGIDGYSRMWQCDLVEGIRNGWETNH